MTNLTFELEIDAALAGRTLADVVRSGAQPACSWSHARELCKRGKVRHNGEVQTDAAVRVQLGDRVSVDSLARRVREHVLPESALVYVDPHVVVVNKPAGLLSVPFAPEDKNTLVDRLRFLLRRTHGARAELGVVQRLDKDTTGLMVFARTLAAKRRLQQAWRVHAIERRYVALVHGALTVPQHFDTQLIRNRGDGLRGSYGKYRQPRGPVPADSQRAVTDVRPLERLRGASLVECQLATGRQHQIRIHLSEAGHPLVGEDVYVRDYRGPIIAAPRIMLHAAVLGFEHPAHGRAMRFELPAPEDIQALLDSLRT